MYFSKRRGPSCVLFASSHSINTPHGQFQAVNVRSLDADLEEQEGHRGSLRWGGQAPQWVLATSAFCFPHV